LIIGGVESLVLRNLILLTAFTPRDYGVSSDLTRALYTLGAITLSHPFEVARVLTVAEQAASV
jgi:hypothetical protein